MKKLLLASLVFIALSAQAQPNHHHSATKHVANQGHNLSSGDTASAPLNVYVSTGVSIGNGDNFKSSSYPSIEAGISKSFYTVGLVAGKSSFEKGSDSFWELKSTMNSSLGTFNGYLLFGAGSYFGTQKVFIEYGTGVTLSTRKCDLFLQVSNWDHNDYISFGISKNIWSFKK